MTELTFRSDVTVTEIDFMGSDERAVQMARVSVKEWDKIEEEAGGDPTKILGSLMKGRHGVPFEHCVATIYAEVPISTARQWVKHRMSSLNEKSGRYGKLLPNFYVPEHDRPMINHGTKMHPKMVPGSYVQHQVASNSMIEVAQAAWKAYEFQLKYDIAEELARNVLPVGLYTTFVWTVNMRSLMNFLERRIEDPRANVPSHPQWEIQLGAKQLEEIFRQHMPISHAFFNEFGRVAP